MAKTSNINIRIDPATKDGAERLFESFGLTISDAVNIFLHQSLMVGGLPFQVIAPRYNAQTEAAMREAQGISSGIIGAPAYASAGDLFKELDREC